MQCEVDGCEKPVGNRKGRRCEAHAKRAHRKQCVSGKVRERYPSPEEAITEAALNLLDLKDQTRDKTKLETAWHRLRAAFYRYKKGRAWAKTSHAERSPATD